MSCGITQDPSHVPSSVVPLTSDSETGPVETVSVIAVAVTEVMGLSRMSSTFTVTT